MTAAPSEKLALLLPADLPDAISLPGPQAATLHQVLEAVHDALRPENSGRRVMLLQALESRLDTETRPIKMPPDTGIPAKSSEIAAFDTYFNLNRVCSAHPAPVLIKGLVQTIIAVQRRAEAMPELPSDLIALQMSGFRAYATVLSRICRQVEPV